jgi:Big-like domain-containing protein
MKTRLLFRSFFGSGICALFLLLAAPLFAQQYQAVILPRPAPFLYAYGQGAGTGRAVGFGMPDTATTDADDRALLWIGTQSPQDITPTGFRAARIDDAEGDQFVGSASNNPGTAFSPLAYLWQNGGSTRVLLHPGEPYQLSEALGVGGGQQVGYVYFGFYCSECGRYIFRHAALWSGSADSFTLLHMAGADETRALDTDGTQQVGYAFYNVPNTPPYHAVLWRGAGNAPIDLHPGPGFSHTFATGVADGQQAGYGWGPATNEDLHALLWKGSAASLVDLNPAGFYASSINAVRGGIQVGGGGRYQDPSGRALAWRGTAASVIDLHALLPAGYQNSNSIANDIDENGNIVGLATEDSTQQTVAVLWKPVTTKPPTYLKSPNVAGSRGQTVSLRATLMRMSNNIVLAGRAIAFKVNGVSVGSGFTNSSGIATRLYTIPASMRGSKPITASFTGDANYQASSASATLTTR